MINEFFSWLQNPDNSSVVMAISTFALTIATFVLAYFSYQQVKASNRQISESRLQKKIEMHNEGLRNLLKSWRTYLPRTPRTGLEIYEFFTPFFEDDPLFIEDLENHLPPKFKDLMQKWKHYKDLRQKYYQTQQEVIDRINPLISNMQKEVMDYHFSPRSIYLKAIELVTGTKYYDYKREQMQYGEPIKYKLDYATQSDAIGYELSSPSIGLTEDEIKKVTEHHENISNIVKKEYENDIRSLIDIENELKDMFNELNDSLIRLFKYPEYDNMTCEYIFRKVKPGITNDRLKICPSY